MTLFGKAMAIALSFALSTLVVPSTAICAERSPTTPPQVQDIPPPPPSAEQVKAARELIERIVRISRLPEIYVDWRRSLRDVTLPLLREAGEGSITGMPAPDAKTAAQIAKVMTLLDYVRRATDELDAPLAEQRDAMISDAAELMAKYSKDNEIAEVSRLLTQPAVIKGMNTFYDVSRLMTGFSLEESRTFFEFSAWAQRLRIDPTTGVPGMPDHKIQPPSPQRTAKALLIVEDLFKVARVEDVMADVKRFMQDVYLETAPLSPGEREELTQQIAKYEFMYNLQKSIVTAAAPEVLAGALTDEQLQVLHGFVRSPAVEKLFVLIRTPIKTATSVTKAEATSMKSLVEELDRKSQFRERSEKNSDKFDAEWNALIEKWAAMLKSRLSPETLKGLEKSFEDVQSIGAPT